LIDSLPEKLEVEEGDGSDSDSSEGFSLANLLEDLFNSTCWIICCTAVPVTRIWELSF